MRFRTYLAAAVTGALALGTASAPAHAIRPLDPAAAGTLVTWGDPANPTGGPAIPIPEDLDQPVVSVAATNRSTGVVTLDGHVRVWGGDGATEWEEVPSGITGAQAIALGIGYGAVLHDDGRITGWGAPDGPDPAAISVVPEGLRATAIAVQGGSGTGYAVRPDGTLAVWGGTPAFTAPEGLTGLVDVVASLTHVIAVHADGTISTWGAPGPAVDGVPDFAGKKVVQAVAGQSRSGVVFEDGTIDIWGPSTPTGEPAFDGLTPAAEVVSLGLWSGNAAAVTADGAVHAWGSAAAMTAVPEDLEGNPASTVTLGNFHVAAIAIAFRDLTVPTVAGDAKVGETLTATPATFSLTPDEPATGQWYADEEPIEGQTGTTLAVDESLLGEEVTYVTTATRDGETVASTSEPVGPVTPATVASTTTLGVSPSTGSVGTQRTVTATVASAGATPTGTVTFTLGGTSVQRALAGGKATWSLPRALKAGRHQVTAAYGGDAGTEPSTSGATTVTVAKAVAKVTAKAKATGKNGKVATLVKVTVTVKTPAGVSAAGKVTVILKGATKKTISVKVNAQGKATASFKKVKAGTYQIALKYGGNDDVKAANGKTTLKI